jgi:hypothetical protein
VYCLDACGLHVLPKLQLAAGSAEFRVVSRNAIEDEFLASPAFSEAQVFLRGKSALYCLKDRK